MRAHVSYSTSCISPLTTCRLSRNTSLMDEQGQGMPATKSSRELGQEKWREPSADRSSLGTEMVEKALAASRELAKNAYEVIL